MVRAGLFDVDRTLIASVDQPAQAWQDAFHDLGHHLPLRCGGFPDAGLRAAGCVETCCDPAEPLAHYEQSSLAQRA